MIHRSSLATMHTGLALATLVAGSSACDRNQAGNLAATSFGDTSHPAERGSPIDALANACGSGQMLARAGDIHRKPYLQQVTATSAMVGWVTMSPTNEQVAITTVTGEPVMTAQAKAELGTQRTAGETQMWASTGAILQPDTVYCYALGDGEALTERAGFRTAPDATSTKPIRFLAFGDSGGGGADQLALRDQMYDFPYEMIVHTGDVAYDSGTIGQFEDNVFGVYSELFRSIPFYPAAGNHEYETMQGAPFREVFALPGDSGEKWYSYDWGRIHFAALDTEADYATQAAWLDQDLAASTAPWKIVYMHRPMYSSGNHGSDTDLRKLIAPVAEKHHVQLVLAGHDHDYERTIPQNGVAYVVTGGGGRGTYNVGASGFTAFSAEVIHFVYVEVGMDELVLHAIDATGVEFDSLVVPRS